MLQPTPGVSEATMPSQMSSDLIYRDEISTESDICRVPTIIIVWLCHCIKTGGTLPLNQPHKTLSDVLLEYHFDRKYQPVGILFLRTK